LREWSEDFRYAALVVGFQAPPGDKGARRRRGRSTPEVPDSDQSIFMVLERRIHRYATYFHG